MTRPRLDDRNGSLRAKDLLFEELLQQPMVAEGAGSPLAAREANRQRLAHRRLTKQTPLRLSSTTAAVATSPAIRCGVLAKRGWLDVRASDRLGDGRFYCVLPAGGSRLECYRGEADSRVLRAIDLAQCGCIHAEDATDRRGKTADVDFHFCLGTAEGSVLFWSSPVDGPSWVSALQTALNSTPAYKQSPPPQPPVADGSPNGVAAPTTPVRSSPCVAPTMVRHLAASSFPVVTFTLKSAEDAVQLPETNGPSCCDRASNSSMVVPPTWVPDDEVAECPLCCNTFGFFLRRHHCRRCGGVFCSGCSDHTIELAMFGIEGQHRVCDTCHSCHQDEQRLVWAVTRRCAPDLVEVADAVADSSTLELVQRIASTPPAGRLEWCTSQHGESILALAAYGACNEALITAILHACDQLDSAAALVDNRDPVALRGALHVACSEGNDGILSVLLSHFRSSEGVVIMKRLLSGKDKYGLTPVDLADRRGHHAASQLCQAWLGAK